MPTMDDVEAGDWVKVVNPGRNALTKGKEYQVTKTLQRATVTLVNDNGNISSFYRDRFEFVRKGKDPVKNKLEVGDRVMCVDTGQNVYIEKGKVYTIKRIDDDGDFIIENRMGKHTGYSPCLFVRYEEPATGKVDIMSITRDFIKGGGA